MGYIRNCEIWHGSSLDTFIMIQEEPILGKGARGYTQQCKILHGMSLGTLIKIQEEPIWRTIWGPCFGHKRAIFWPFLGKVDYWIHPELWCLAWTIPGKIDYDSGRTNLKGHKRVIFWSFLSKEDHWILKKLDPPWARWLLYRKNQFEGPCEDPLLAIKGPYLGHF